MTYLRDLSRYPADGLGCSGSALSIGWLKDGQPYQTGSTTDRFLNRLWALCKISIERTRGLHRCEFCGDEYRYGCSWQGETLLLGAAEIRAFGTDMTVFAAPNLIFHYVAVHGYRPPDPFVQAVEEGLAPPEPAYFTELERRHISWRETSAVEGKIRRFDDPDW